MLYMLKNFYKQYIIILFLIFNSNHMLNNNISDELSYENKAKAEIKKQLLQMLNFILANGYVQDLEQLSETEIEDIFNEILNDEEIKNKLILIIINQLKIKEKNKTNNQQIDINKFFQYYSYIGFRLCLFPALSNNDNKNILTKYINTLLKVIFSLSLIGEITTKILKKKLKKIKKFFFNADMLLQKKKMQMNNVLINLLINKLQEKVK